jgi:hypothetical protein
VLPKNEHLPTAPAAKLVGPFLRLTNFDPASGAYALSVLVVTHPSMLPPGETGEGLHAVPGALRRSSPELSHTLHD